MKKKNIARIAVYPVLVIVVILIFRPVTGSTAHHQIKEELKNEILTAYFWELESGARLVRPLSWIEITGERYTDGRYQPAIHFDPAGEDIRVMTGKNSWMVYEIHLDKLGGARMNSVFIEQSRYPPKNQSANQSMEEQPIQPPRD